MKKLLAGLLLLVLAGAGAAGWFFFAWDAAGPAEAEKTVMIAPRTPLQIVPAARLVEEAATLAGEGSRVAVLARTCPDPRDARLTWRNASPGPAGFAHDLYASLRELDACGADFIVVEALPETPDWQAITDRLGRAAVGSGDGEAEPDEHDET